MKKTNKKTLEEIIRVDHAGERGAIKIYEGQLLALKTIKQDDSLKNKIEQMKNHENEHLQYFEKEIQKRKIKPTYLLPLWDVMGITLGFGTALLGKKAAMLCTASVEEVIENHYENQLKKNTISCKEVTFAIFGVSLASINTIFSFVLFCIFFNMFKKYENYK